MDGGESFDCEWCGKPCWRSDAARRLLRPGVCVRCDDEARAGYRLAPLPIMAQPSHP